MHIRGQICQDFFIKPPQKTRKTWLHEGDEVFTLEVEGAVGFLLNADPSLQEGTCSSGALADVHKHSPHAPYSHQPLCR